MSYIAGKNGRAMGMGSGDWQRDIRKAHDTVHGVTRNTISGYMSQAGVFDNVKSFFTPASSDALPKQLQKETNRYAGVAFATPIGEDGKIGSDTVIAVRAVASFLIKQGAVQSDSFVQSGASANAAYILAHVSEYISIFDREANKRGLTGKSAPKQRPEKVSLPLPGEPPPGGGMLDSLMAGGVGGVSPVMLLGGAALVYYLATRKKRKGR